MHHYLIIVLLLTLPGGAFKHSLQEEEEATMRARSEEEEERNRLLIYNGARVIRSEFPAVVGIKIYPDGLYLHYGLCTGTILRSNIVLTASHCFCFANLQEVVVHIYADGLQDMSSPTGGDGDYSVYLADGVVRQRVCTEINQTSLKLSKDLALIRTARPFNPMKSRAAELFDSELCENRDECGDYIAVGFGLDKKVGENTAGLLRKGIIKRVDYCYIDEGDDYLASLCYYYPNEKQYHEDGDSGGALFNQLGQIVGVVSGYCNDTHIALSSVYMNRGFIEDAIIALTSFAAVVGGNSIWIYNLHSLFIFTLLHFSRWIN